MFAGQLGPVAVSGKVSEGIEVLPVPVDGAMVVTLVNGAVPVALVIPDPPKVVILDVPVPVPVPATGWVELVNGAEVDGVRVVFAVEVPVESPLVDRIEVELVKGAVPEDAVGIEIEDELKNENVLDGAVPDGVKVPLDGLNEVVAVPEKDVELVNSALLDETEMEVPLDGMIELVAVGPGIDVELVNGAELDAIEMAVPLDGAIVESAVPVGIEVESVNGPLLELGLPVPLDVGKDTVPDPDILKLVNGGLDVTVPLPLEGAVDNGTVPELKEVPTEDEGAVPTLEVEFLIGGEIVLEATVLLDKLDAGLVPVETNEVNEVELLNGAEVGIEGLVPLDIPVDSGIIVVLSVLALVNGAPLVLRETRVSVETDIRDMDAGLVPDMVVVFLSISSQQGESQKPPNYGLHSCWTKSGEARGANGRYTGCAGQTREVWSSEFANGDIRVAREISAKKTTADNSFIFNRKTCFGFSLEVTIWTCLVWIVARSVAANLREAKICLGTVIKTTLQAVLNQT